MVRERARGRLFERTRPHAYRSRPPRRQPLLPSPRLSRRGPNLAGSRVPARAPRRPGSAAARAAGRASPQRGFAETQHGFDVRRVEPQRVLGIIGGGAVVAQLRSRGGSRVGPARLGSNLAASVKSACRVPAASRGVRLHPPVVRRLRARLVVLAVLPPGAHVPGGGVCSTAMASSAAVASRISRSSAWTAGEITHAQALRAPHEIFQLLGAAKNVPASLGSAQGRTSCGGGSDTGMASSAMFAATRARHGDARRRCVRRRREGRDGSRGRAGEETAQNARSWRQINVGEAFCRKRKLTTVSLAGRPSRVWVYLTGASPRARGRSGRARGAG